MSTKYERRSSATSVELEVAAVIMASLYSLSCFDNDIDSSHRAFFFEDNKSQQVPINI